MYCHTHAQAEIKGGVGQDHAQHVNAESANILP